MKVILIVFFVSVSLCSVKCLLVHPHASCVPTQIVKGPCHECMCDADGVFVCHATACPNSTVNPWKSYKGECQPHVTYRFEELYCTCKYDGRWLSLNCRETFQYLRPDKTAAESILRSNSTISCTPNSLFLIDCNICQCEDTGTIQPTSCTNRPCTAKGHKSDACKFGDFLRTKDEICICSGINFYIDRLCVKVDERHLQELDRNVIALITNTSQIRKNMDACLPLKEYRLDCNVCVCNWNRQLVCTNKICNSKVALRIEGEGEDFYSLPSVQHEKQECVPDEKYRIKCNTCVCSKKGTLTCTTMVCLEDFIFDEGALADRFI